VKHVTTVNADQAVIADGIISSNAPRETPKLAAGANKAMQIIEPSQKEAVPVGGGTKRK
jgi:hypothetical protein